MASTYKVQKGDTLSKIAANAGVKLSDISGYKSGDPNKIFEGETLTLGKAAPASDPYVDEVKDQLGGDSPKSKTSIYDADTLKIERDTYKSGLDTSFKNLQKIQQDTFESEYEKRDLGKKKEKMSELDSSIAAKRAERDAALNKVRTNPGLSAAQMTGDIKKMADFANAEINNLIQERNAVAGEYNASLDEIDGLVERKASGAKAEYDYYAGLYNNTESKLAGYQASLLDELKSDREADQFDRQLAQAMEIAQLNASTKGGSGSGSNLQLRSDPNTGDPLYWFDPDTGAITYIDEGGDDEEEISFDTPPAPAADTTKKWWQFWK